MNIMSRHRLTRFAAFLFVLTGSISFWCDLWAQSKTPEATPPTRTRQSFASVTLHAPDAFYDPPAQVPSRPGVLLRSEPLRDVTLSPGMRGWRILYTTAVDDNTPATAVATVFAPVNSPDGPRPAITREHGIGRR